MIKDKNGAERHILSRRDLSELYKKLEDFTADLAEEEYKKDKEAFIKVFTAIHQQERKRK